MLTGPVDVTREAAEARRHDASTTSTCSSSTRPSPRVVLRYMQAFDLDHGKVNVNGGAIAMGHPLGATGAMILGTVLDELERARSEHGAGHAVHRRRHGHRHHHRTRLSDRTR